MRVAVGETVKSEKPGVSQIRRIPVRNAFRGCILKSKYRSEFIGKARLLADADSAGAAPG